MLKKIVVFVSVLLVLSMSLGACAPAATPEAKTETPPALTQPVKATQTLTELPTPTEISKRGGRLVYTETGGYYTLDPFITPWHSAPQYAVFDTLIALTPDLTDYAGILVENWQPAADNLSVTFKVRPGITFSDGTVVDAEAIKWNLDHWRDPNVAAPGGGWMTGVVKEIVVDDELTFTIKLEAPYAPLYFQLSSMEIVSPTAYQEMGPDKFALDPVGAGPWVVKEIVADNSLLLSRREDYHWYPSFSKNRESAYPDEYLLKYLSDEAVIYAAFETGELDIAPIPPQYLPQARKNSNIVIVQGLNNGLDYLGFNTQSKAAGGALQNTQVRIAIGLGINRDELVMAGLEGEATPVWSPLAPSEWGYSESAEAYARETQPYNPQKAKEMLALEGWKVGDGNGVAEKDGVELAFELAYPVGDKNKRVAETLQAQLIEIGVKVNLAPMEFTAVKDKTLNGTHEMILWLFGLVDPSILTYLYHSSRVGASNRTWFSDPNIDELLIAADQAMDPEVRKQAVDAAERYLIDQRPMIPLYVIHTYNGYRKDHVDGLMFDKLGNVIINDANMLVK